MAAIKDINKSSDKWQRRAALASPDYLAGVKTPRRSWSEAASAGEANYKAGVQAAATKGAYGAGVKKAGDAAWQKGAQEKGPARYSEGVALATQDWAAGFQPYHQTISSLQLPARGPAGSPQNLARVAAVANANRQLKEKLGK